MMNNKLCLTTGRVIFGLPFAVFGFNHIMMADAMTMMVPSFLPAAIFWVYLSGVALLLAGLAIMLNRYTRWACYGLMLFLAAVILTVHVPMMMAGTNMPMPMISILKDLGLFGGALMLSTLDK